MRLRTRVHRFQGALLATAEKLLNEGENTPSQLSAIACLTALAMVIDAADDAGAFDDDLSEVREAPSPKE